MAFLSAAKLIYIRVFALLGLSFLFVRNPLAITEAPSVQILTLAMRLPEVVLEKGNPVFGLLLVMFTLLALADLVPMLSGNVVYFEQVLPVRLLMFFGLGAASYLLESAYFGNNLVFIYSFVEVWANFLIYTSLREEAVENAKKWYQKQKRMQLSSELDDEEQMRRIMGEVRERIKDAGM